MTGLDRPRTHARRTGDLVMGRHLQVRQRALSRRRLAPELAERRDHLVGTVGDQVDLPLPRRGRAGIGEIDDRALVGAIDGGVGVIEEGLQALGEPVIAARLLAVPVHALLNHRPSSVVGDHEAVQVQIETVLHCSAVDLGHQSRGSRQLVPGQAELHPEVDQLLRSLARVLTPPATYVDPQLAGSRSQSPFERSHDRGRDPRGVPVHPHHRPERLKPKRVGQPAQELVAPVVQHDRFGDQASQSGHASGEPGGHPSPVQRKVGRSGRAPHRPAQ